MKGRTPGVVQRFLCSLSQFSADLQNTLTKSILIFLSETFQVTIFTPKALLEAIQTKQFNISLEGSISFLLPQRNERFKHLQGERFCRNLQFYRNPVEQGCLPGKILGSRALEVQGFLSHCWLGIFKLLTEVWIISFFFCFIFFSCFSLEKPN